MMDSHFETGTENPDHPVGPLWDTHPVAGRTSDPLRPREKVVPEGDRPVWA